MPRSLVPGPAGLSSDTLEQSPPSPGRMGQEDNENEQWSDAHDMLETDDERDAIQEISEPQGDLTLRPPKIASVATSSESMKAHEMDTPFPTASSPPPPQAYPSQDAEEGSVRSLPLVQVTEPSSPAAMNTRSISEAHSASPAASLAPTTTSSLDRRGTLRAGDTRGSNRISGFFSNLIHRRDHLPPTTRESMTPPPSTPLPNESSRTSSPLPSRPATPPPSLPAPSLSDLGLSLSSITSPLSPSHFSTPPCSGAFLQPHYLLLCHAQGLDVLPLVSPPAPQPYSLIRRVPFKSVVVMEHRGVLVAIAGRRDGVRVYALEEVKRAVEWRIEVEVKREREKNRREEMKKNVLSNHDKKLTMNKKENGHILPSSVKARPERRATVSAGSETRLRTPPPPRPRPQTPPPNLSPSGPPPPYSPPSRTRSSTLVVPDDPLPVRVRTTSVGDVLAGTIGRRGHDSDDVADNNSKGLKESWDSSDDEAIDLMAAPSGSQALDERTSAAAAATTASTPPARVEVTAPPRTSISSATTTRRRPANLDLSLTRASPPGAAVAVAAPPSPTPTLLTLRQALMASPGSSLTVTTRPSLNAQLQTGSVDADDEEEAAPSSPTTPTRERISLAEALMESRLPDLPPAGTQRSQTAILLGSTHIEENNFDSPRTSESFSTQTRRSVLDSSTRRRRRWSVFDGIFQQPSSPTPAVPAIPGHIDSAASNQSLMSSQTETRQRQTSTISRSQSTRMLRNRDAGSVNSELPARPSSTPGEEQNLPLADSPSSTPISPQPPSTSAHSSRFLPRIITNAFNPRRSDDRPGSPRISDLDGRKILTAQLNAQAPAPKLEYVKLPGTKGSVMVKAVETAKKSFLAILCGENGEKVELFAGTYRTALGLSRTFILPDSPRSLELQLQGDDLVEVFLVFSQNVFGLEPATVRVREVRIGRAERRAARRRLREAQQSTDPGDPEALAADDDTAVNVTIGVAVAPPTLTPNEEYQPSPLNSPLPGTMHPADIPANPSADIASTVTNPANKEELLSLAAAHNSPYTTFQQLAFSPNFPLAAIADEYIIPPTYPSFLQYRTSHEPEESGKAIDLSQIQFSPPGLPVPPVIPPSQWYYRDPKGVVHGPWPESLMQQWYKDALLPPDLPVRSQEETQYTLLKDLRLQSVDPTHPFRSSPPPPNPSSSQAHLMPSVDPSKPLLSPISVLCQPRHFGPPALFFSSRGGHSTTIVDARGRSVLKSRFMWSTDEDEDHDIFYNSRLGDVKRLEAFDVQDRAVLVALRQGGVEIVDFGDALLLPADSSRTDFPHFHPPTSSVNRRGAFIWRIGERTSPQSDSPPMPSLPQRLPHRFPGKKTSNGPSKLQGRNDSMSGEADSEHSRDEVFFLGRKEDDLYFCERRFGSFRVLRLSPLPTAF
ncbi:hypothetical protein BC835DRAFT_1315795 [Cytidiella melzeri]|nr:hypothetical protein BC835DRAFT_1315795 [Cytidiella melzeri]